MIPMYGPNGCRVMVNPRNVAAMAAKGLTKEPPAETSDETSDETGPKAYPNLLVENMTRDELEAHALKHHNIDIDKRRKLSDLRAEVKALDLEKAEAEEGGGE